MRQDIPAYSSSTPCEDLSHCLPGFTLTHTVHLVSGLNLGVVSTAADVLEGEQIVVDRWAVTRFGDVLEQRIVFGAVSEREAVRLREQLAAIEHHFVRAR